MTPSLSDVARMVDLERYPIHALDGERCESLVEGWKSELDRTGACNLHGFLTASGARELAVEAEAMMPMAYERTFTANFRYQDKADPEIPASGPASRFWTTSSLHLASDQFTGTKLDRLYRWDALTELVARIQGKTKLYRDADEFQALNVIALTDGNRTIFHHDQVECVVTLLLQAPIAGGEFLYCPDTRDADGIIDLDAVGKALDEEPGSIKGLERGEGTLTLFRGGHSLHGVTPVRGGRKRVSAILSYDSKPDRVAKDVSNCRLYGPRVERILAGRRLA